MKIAIIGAGLAGATAYQLLKEKHRCVIMEASDRIGGMLYDRGGVQWYGPRAFHTDNKAAWEFVNRFAQFRPFDLRVEVQTDPAYSREFPFTRHDQAWTAYSEKAWGMKWGDLPKTIQDRVPQICTDGRIGYHKGKYKGQPSGGYYELIKTMLAGASVEYETRIIGVPFGYDVFIWTGNINDVAKAYGVKLPWIGRSWAYHECAHIETNCHVINYATHRIPQIRSWKTSINPYHDAQAGVMSEYMSGEVDCYPHPNHEREASELINLIHENKTTAEIVLCGRLGSYQYLDMDKCIENVTAAVAHLM